MKFEKPQIFLREGRTFDVEPDQPLFARGGSRKDVYLLVSGQLLLYSSTVRGREFVIDIVKEGDLFGLASLLADTRHEVDAITLTRCTVAAIDAAILRSLMARDPELAFSIVAQTVRHMLRRTTQAEGFALLGFAGRLAKLLLGMAEDQGVNLVKGCTFKREVSQALMARMIGVSRETVSRQFQRWEDGGLLASAGKVVTLHDPGQLRRIADGSADPAEPETSS